MHKWLFSGELYDPFAEFFVSLDTDPTHFMHGLSSGEMRNPLSGDGGLERFGTDGDDYSGTREDGLKLWDAKYRFRQEMLPLFVGDVFGKKVNSIRSRYDYWSLIDCRLDFLNRKKSQLHPIQLS